MDIEEITDLAVLIQVRLELKDSLSLNDLPDEYDSIILDYLNQNSDVQPIENINDLLEHAKDDIERFNLKSILCPYLTVLSEDISDFAKVTYTVLLPLTITGTLSIPLSPILFAAIAVIFYRGSSKLICKDYNDEK